MRSSLLAALLLPWPPSVGAAAEPVDDVLAVLDSDVAHRVFAADVADVELRRTVETRQVADPRRADAATTLGIGRAGPAPAAYRVFPPVYDGATTTPPPSFAVDRARMPAIARAFDAAQIRIARCFDEVLEVAPVEITLGITLDARSRVVGVRVVSLAPDDVVEPVDCLWTAVRRLRPPGSTTDRSIELRHGWWLPARWL